MNRIKTLIVDDETLARKRIKKLLLTDDDIHLVNEFELGTDAIDYIAKYTVDLVFLDIHMPEIDGFQVLRKLPEENRPFIIFATADNESALKAFEYKALDYLLKPFRNKRFYEALENAKSYINLKRNADLGKKLVSVVQGHDSEHPKNITLNGNISVDFDDVIYISTEGNYIKVYKEQNDFLLVRKTMNEVESELGNQFLRIHRSLLVNTYFVQQINYIGNNEFIIMCASGIELKSSRSYKAKIDEYINKL